MDLSPHMLEHAVRNNSKWIEQSRASFAVGDAADFTLEHPVSFAVSMFDALNHLPDIEALRSCAASVFRALRSSGMFVFDLNTPFGLQRWNSVNVVDRSDITLIDRGIYAPGGDRAYTSIVGYVKRDDGAYDRFEQYAYNTVFQVPDVLRILRQTGFSVCYVATEQDLSQAAQSPEVDRAFFVCTKG